MRGKRTNLAFSALEMLRFASVVAFVPGLASAGGGFLQAALSANLLYACAFFFMWLDAERYAAFRYLVAAGKVVGAVFLLKTILAGLTGAPERLAYEAIVPGIVFLYDALAIVWTTALMRLHEGKAAAAGSGDAALRTRVETAEPQRLSPATQTAPASQAAVGTPQAQARPADAPQIETIDIE